MVKWTKVGPRLVRMETPPQARNNQSQNDENQEVEQVRTEVEQNRTQNQPTQNAPQRANDPRYRSLWENKNPPLEDPLSCIVMEDVYPMSANTLAQLLTFHGVESENPYAYIHDFKALRQSLCEANTYMETMCLTLFPFTMKDKVKIWLRSLPSLSI